MTETTVPRTAPAMDGRCCACGGALPAGDRRVHCGACAADELARGAADKLACHFGHGEVVARAGGYAVRAVLAPNGFWGWRIEAPGRRPDTCFGGTAAAAVRRCAAVMAADRARRAKEAGR